MTSKPQCLLYSFAMALGKDPMDIAELLGHDGMEITRPQYTNDYKYRSFHIQEFVDLCRFEFQKDLALIELYPVIGIHGEIEPVYLEPLECKARFEKLVAGRIAVMLGITLKGGGHAVAWDGSKILDPRGTTYNLYDRQLNINEAWIVI